MSTFYRIFLLQLVVYIPFYILAVIIPIVQRTHNLPQNNQWIFNIAMPLETLILTWASYEYFKLHKRKNLIWVGYAIYLIVIIADISYTGFKVLSIRGYIAESILLIILNILMLNRYFREEKGSWKNSPLVWISLGIIFFFGGVMPYFSLMNYLQIGHSRINLILYNLIIGVFANLRYIFLAIGFWLIRRNAVKKISISNE